MGTTVSRRLVCVGLQAGQNLAEALGFNEMPGPVAQLVVNSPNLILTIPAVKDQTMAIQDFAKMPLSVHARLHSVCQICMHACMRTQICLLACSTARCRAFLPCVCRLGPAEGD